MWLVESAFRQVTVWPASASSSPGAYSLPGDRDLRSLARRLGPDHERETRDDHERESPHRLTR